MSDYLKAEIKTTGQLIDELITVSQRIYHLIDKAIEGTASGQEATRIQELNNRRNELIRAIDRRLGDQDIGGKVY